MKFTRNEEHEIIINELIIIIIIINEMIIIKQKNICFALSSIFLYELCQKEAKRQNRQKGINPKRLKTHIK